MSARLKKKERKKEKRQVTKQCVYIDAPLFTRKTIGKATKPREREGYITVVKSDGLSGWRKVWTGS